LMCVNGTCCAPSKVCGSGSSATCCTSLQTCVAGKCVP
jgi:hypothetical protein